MPLPAPRFVTSNIKPFSFLHNLDDQNLNDPQPDHVQALAS